MLTSVLLENFTEVIVILFRSENNRDTWYLKTQKAFIIILQAFQNKYLKIYQSMHHTNANSSILLYILCIFLYLMSCFYVKFLYSVSCIFTQQNYLILQTVF